MSPCFQVLFAVDSYGEYISWTNCSRKVKGISNVRMPRERKPTLFVDSYVTLYTKNRWIAWIATDHCQSEQTDPPKSSDGQITLWEGQSRRFLGFCISFFVIFGWEKKKTQFK